jgi:hypothetical protein
MDNHEEMEWVMLVYGGIFLAAIAISTFITALVASAACLRKKFPVQPVILYWLAFAILLTIWQCCTWIGAVWIALLGSPVFIVLFWYYDKINTRLRFTKSNSSHNADDL